jgi:hypothetical protein
MEKERRDLTINFMDGSKTSFAFSLEGRNAAAKQLRLEEFLKSPFLMVLGDGVLTMYPVANIKSIQLTVDAKELDLMRLPGHVIRNARQGRDA